jgi:hypothetical protein
MRERSAAKPMTVTDADIERVLADAGMVRDRLIDLIVRIGAGQCERLADPLSLGRRCITLCDVYSVAAQHFLSRAQAQNNHPKI